MAKTNKKALDHRVDRAATPLAGGYGPAPAKQDSEALLRRSVLACLLWEDIAYQDGTSVVETIRRLIPLVDPKIVCDIATEARTKQKLRHVPLLIAREMARYATHKTWARWLLPQIILRPDEMMEFLALYWKDGKKPIPASVKRGLAASFDRFDAYQFAKWRGEGSEIKLRDVMFLVHPRPLPGREEMYKQIADNTLPTPDTWEVALSGGADKKATWERLLSERKLGALAFLRNLRNMTEVGVDRDVMLAAFDNINPRWLLPVNYTTAAAVVPRWEREIETLMLKSLKALPVLPGYTILVVDVSGSMQQPISAYSSQTRLDVAATLAMQASERCEHLALYVTSGNDSVRVHTTKLLAPNHGFAVVRDCQQAAAKLGGGGIFTRQCLEHIKVEERGAIPDRIIVFSDSQDCDIANSKPPRPFGKRNYIVDVSSHDHGINYAGTWTAEIVGWSERFLDFIMAAEGQDVAEAEEESANAVN